MSLRVYLPNLRTGQSSFTCNIADASSNMDFPDIELENKNVTRRLPSLLIQFTRAI